MEVLRRVIDLMDKHTIIKLKKEGHSIRSIAKLTSINRKTITRYWKDYLNQQVLLETADNNQVSVIQEQICSKPTYDR